MSKRFISTVAMGIIGFLVFLFLYIRITTSRELSILSGKEKITMIKVEVISSPYYDEKRTFIINDQKILDSLDIYLKQNSVEVDKHPAKLNDVFVILEIIKGNNKTNIEILNSKYTGWLLVIGNKTFSNTKIIEFIDTYLK